MGYISLLTNEFMPNTVKLGSTNNKEHLDYTVVFEVRVPDRELRGVEEQCRLALSEYEVGKSRWYFKLPVDRAVSIVSAIFN